MAAVAAGGRDLVYLPVLVVSSDSLRDGTWSLLTRVLWRGGAFEYAKFCIWLRAQFHVSIVGG
jgi:hypothetical protein